MTTERFVADLREQGHKVTSVQPGVVAANDGRWYARYEQTSQGWRHMSLGPVFR